VRTALGEQFGQTETPRRRTEKANSEARRRISA
jgi:hypothetical protein